MTDKQFYGWYYVKSQCKTAESLKCLLHFSILFSWRILLWLFRRVHSPLQLRPCPLSSLVWRRNRGRCQLCLEDNHFGLEWGQTVLKVGKVLVRVRGRVQQLHDQHLVQGVGGGERRGQRGCRRWGTCCGRTRSERKIMRPLSPIIKASLYDNKNSNRWLLNLVALVYLKLSTPEILFN